MKVIVKVILRLFVWTGDYLLLLYSQAPPRFTVNSYFSIVVIMRYGRIMFSMTFYC